MYNFVTGPLAWFSFLVFFIGILVRGILYIKGLDAATDRITYNVNRSHGIKEAIRSIFYWLVPFGTRGWRTQPVITILFLIFHTSLLVSPLFLTAHNFMLKERWGIQLFSLPDIVSDYLTIAVIVSACGLTLRRIILANVRIITTPWDYILLMITVAPFITGYIAFHQFGHYPFWMIAHILTGELMLVAIPFTKLSHCILFFLLRAQLGMDYGIKRGGMKRKAMAW